MLRVKRKSDREIEEEIKDIQSILRNAETFRRMDEAERLKADLELLREKYEERLIKRYGGL